MQKKTKVLIICLLGALIFSNIIWAYGYLNLYIFSEYQVGFVKARSQIIDQLFSVIPIIATGKAKRKEVVSAAQLNGRVSIELQNKSYVQVGALTFKFDRDDEFVALEND